MADMTATIQLDQVLSDAGRVAVGGHLHPDGDCAGSTTSLCRYIRKRYPGTTVDLYLEKIPDAYDFLGDGLDIRHALSGGEPEYDLFIALDCGEKSRLGFSEPVFDRAARTLCIDHHISNTGFADINRVCPDASSTSEMLAEEMKLTDDDADIAQGLFLGIVHDTGVFQNSCTSPKTHRIAASLLETGFNASDLITKTYYEKTFSQQLVQARALLNARLEAGGRVIVSSISLAEMHECGVTFEHLDGIVSHLRDTKGVECAVFLYEKTTGNWKISFRSKDYIDVCLAARRFGGGGHQRAAGADIAAADADTAFEQILPVLLEQITAESE